MEKELIEYVRSIIESEDLHSELSVAYDRMDRMRCPLSYANSYLHGRIEDAIDDFCLDHDLSFEDYDAEDIFWKL